MFGFKPEPCFDLLDHKPHVWRMNGFRMRECPGYSHEAELEEFFIEYGKSLVDAREFKNRLPQPHKHNLRITLGMVDSAGRWLDIDNLVWSCDCGYDYVLNRDVFKRLMAGEIYLTEPRLVYHWG